MKPDGLQRTMTLNVPLTPEERERLDAVCGPRRPMKRGAWVREAILARLADEEAAELAPTAGRKARGRA